MKFATYRQTPGLERYPGCEGFKVWRAVNKQLKRDDADYRKRCDSYLASMIYLAILPMTFLFLPQNAVGILATVVLTLVYVVLAVVLAFRQQAFMNERIGQFLQGSEPTPGIH